MRSEYRRVAAIIPALNEEAALPRVVEGVRRSVERVLVVDNGSTDRTAQVARDHGAYVVFEGRRGYGSALLRGLSELDRIWPDVEVVVFVDGDASDDPEGLRLLIEPILDQRADFVLGSRLLGPREPGALPLHSMWGNRFACWLIALSTGFKYTDLGPFRAIRRSTLETLGMTDRDFGWTAEMQIKAARCGATICEIPVPYRRRIGKSKISGTLLGSLRAGGKILYTIVRYGIGGLRPTWRLRTRTAG